MTAPPLTAGLARDAIESEAAFKIIGAVEDDLCLFSDFGELVFISDIVDGVDLYVRIDRLEAAGGGFCFQLSDIRGGMQYLPLQVGQVNPIKIAQGQLTNTRRCQVKCCG